MITDIRVPKLGMSEDEITIIEYPIEDGEQANEGDVVVVIETAKVSHEVSTPAPGLVFHVKEVNDKVSIGSLLAVVADSREEFEAYREKIDEELQGQSGEDIDKDEMEETVTLAPTPIPTPTPAPEPEPEIEVVPETASEKEADMLNGRRVFKRIPYIGMRRTIAHNLHSSLQTMAQLTIVSETDMTALSLYRDELILDYPDTKITFVDLLVKLLPAALKEYPIMNSVIHEDEIVCWDEYNIGVAMSLEEGLVVPVVREVDKKSLVQLSRQIKSLAVKARNRQLTAEHLQGGTFSFSSGGKVDTDIITPIIKPPETAILAIGKIGPKPAVYEGKLAIRTMTNLCLTHDHRVIDGVPASRFLGRLKQIIETPADFRGILK